MGCRVKAGGCKWDWFTRKFCKLGCGKCKTEDAPFYETHPVVGIMSFKDVAKHMRQKVGAAQVAMQLSAARNKVSATRAGRSSGHLDRIFLPPGCKHRPVQSLFRGSLILQIHHANYVRLSQARIDPATCRPSQIHDIGAAVRKQPLMNMQYPHTSNSIQHVCQFNVKPVRPPAECSDMSKACNHARAEDCYGVNFAQLRHTCPKTCGFCQGCSDRHSGCRAWSMRDQCKRNSGFMLETCQLSCKLCTRYYDEQPPAFTTLHNGLLMPVVGFGTAGLGSATRAAVTEALQLGYRHIDSAQGQQWYREDDTGQVRCWQRTVLQGLHNPG
jgi:hypothetical protein